LTSLAGVSSAERRGEAVILHCADSDAAIRALLDVYPGARDIEIAAAGLEQAFLTLTGDEPTDGGGGLAAPGGSEGGLPAPGGSEGALPGPRGGGAGTEAFG
ncbi:MAG TPA: hypothetical protein VK680_15305, partial [Solirubrobacteraceae bacterium]|nr:hypothetical protein [Solirubrobacteraceae bacterium]